MFSAKTSVMTKVKVWKIGIAASQHPFSGAGVGVMFPDFLVSHMFKVVHKEVVT